MTANSHKATYPVTAAWGAFGVIAVCAFAVWRLAPFVVAAVSAGLSPVQWGLLIANILFMAWTEGYRGFQVKFSPRVAARALYLYRTRVPLWMRLLAPIFCFGYFHAQLRAKLVAWIGTMLIVILILVIHQLDQPWRGIIDAGVVVGLSWGIVTLFVSCLSTIRAGEYLASPEVPEAIIDESIQSPLA
jgi:hypothetical protein